MLKAKIQQSVDYLLPKISIKPRIALVLGSGLSPLAESMTEKQVIPYKDIPNFLVSTAPGHSGNLVIGKISGVPVICMQGRFHYYEGYSLQDITYPIRVFAALGITRLILTNACGGINPDFVPGTLMLIRDHINMTGNNPLIGANVDFQGPRFPDMTHAYDPNLCDLAKKAAAEQGLNLAEGVYVGYSGPSFETPAEIRAFRMLGGDAVGMSTVPEAIVANHCGLKVLGISCITNFASGILDVPLTSEEVMEVAGKASADFVKLLQGVIKLIA